ncbi:PaaX family transcriptional regulator C-terminal domain-containing protein [Cumulibacter soli]|uniref:PaaX family transcriptional regulator C-terminal domain-containing protein n=1 Tax=Cumulibacter soli TaxID=2546344 RepID=UPI0010686758|nr:PaaX family transcriptional regulator C-terminal domain-containing protein [Cumulibacter soli]
MGHTAQERNGEDLVRPLSTRSVLLSALLGAHPPSMPVGKLVRLGTLFGVSEGTVRVAVSRMYTAGELARDGEEYRLTERLIARQRRQDASRWPQTQPWTDRWQMLVVTSARRSRGEREDFRTAMTAKRFAELREGLWLRPDNLIEKVQTPYDGCLSFTAQPNSDPAELAARLWDLPTWAQRARALHDAMNESATIPEAFAVSAAVLRHLLVDPVLPHALLPADWPGEALRARYADFDSRFRARLSGYLDEWK